MYPIRLCLLLFLSSIFTINAQQPKKLNSSEIYEAVQKNDFNEAQKLFYKQINLLKFIVEKGLPRAIKAGLNLQGIDGGHLRKHLQSLEKEEINQLETILNSFK